MAKLFANDGDSDQMQHFAASDLGLHCVPITLWGSKLKWVSKCIVIRIYLIWPKLPLSLRKLGKKLADDYLKQFTYFVFKKIGFDISCKLSPRDMKYQSLFSGKKVDKNIISLLSTEFL